MATKKDILWSYSGYLFNLGFSLILLPFTLRFLNQHELGLWYTFLSIGAFVTMLDFGFMPTITRNFSYAFAGEIILKKDGISNNENLGHPNINLIDSLLVVTNKIYKRLSFISLMLLILIGTPYIYYINNSVFSYELSVSWLFFVLGCFLNFYYSYWGSILTAVGGIQEAQKSLIVSRIVQLTISILGLYNGYNLIAVTFSYFISGLILRQVYKYYYNSIYKSKIINNKKGNYHYDSKYLYEIIWYNAKKQGIVSVAGFLIMHGNILLTSSFINLETTSKLGISQTIIQIISGFSKNFFTVKIPIISQFISKGNLVLVKSIISKSIFIYWFVFVFLISLFLLFSDLMLSWVNTKIEFLEGYSLVILILIIFLETNHSLFATIITLNNNIPFIKPALISGISIFLLCLSGALFFEFDIAGLLTIQFLVQLAYNNWKWPFVVMKKYDLNPISIITTNLNSFIYGFFQKRR